MKKGILVCLAAVLVAGGCSSLRPFTHEKRSTYGLSSAEIEHIQFYPSQQIELDLAVPAHMMLRANKQGALETKSVYQYDEKIVIPAGWPGRVVNAQRDIGPYWVDVAFDDPTRYRPGVDITLRFHAVQDQQGGRYYLAYKDKPGVINYDGLPYSCSPQSPIFIEFQEQELQEWLACKYNLPGLKVTKGTEWRPIYGVAPSTKPSLWTRIRHVFASCPDCDKESASAPAAEDCKDCDKKAKK